MTKALLLFTIGPVKQFVEPSRKLKDLYAGSFLLSYIALQTKAFFAEHGGNVFIPSPNAQNAPNRIVLLTEDIKKAEHMAKKAESFVQEEFLTIAETIIEKSQLQFNEAVKNQLSGFLEINWAAEPIEDDFQTTYKKLLKHIHSSKNTRMFQQIVEVPARKCDLYGQYNALFTSYEKPLLNLQKTNLKKGENLSAIATVKRMLNKWAENQPVSFDMNVTSVAYMLLKSYFPETIDLTQVKDEASEALFDLKNEENILIHSEYTSESKRTASSLYKTYSKYIGTPYYAIVKLDGDGVGTKYQQIQSVEEAEKLSEEISEFAGCAKQIIECNKGVCVFAGGEDILAFLPLHTLFTALQEIVSAFRQIEQLNYKGTLSAGIIVAHLMSPLKPLLQEVESLESHAKSIDEEKAAFSMNIMRRGGLITPLRLKFGIDGENLEVIQKLIHSLQTSQHSASFIQSVVTMISGIDIVTDEILEVLLRKLLRSSEVRANYIDEHITTLLKVYELAGKEIEVFINVLIQASFMARTMFQAPEKEECRHDV